MMTHIYIYNTKNRCVSSCVSRVGLDLNDAAMFHIGFSLTMLVFVALLSTKSCHLTNGEMMHVS